MPELTDAQKVMRNDTGKSIAEAIANMSITVAGQEIEVSDTEPQSKFVDVWFQEQQHGTPVEVYTVPEINNMIAPAETSPTQAAHHVGEYIICVLNCQAKLYKVIDEISIQETLTVGGNIEAVTVADRLVRYMDITITLTTSEPRVRTAQTGLSAQQYVLLSATLVANNDFYYFTATDGILSALAISGTEVNIYGLNKNLSTAETRTLIIRCSYMHI